MNASKYEDYNDTSATYDGARMPIDAADLKATIEGVAASTGKPLASLRVLDSGCGTANYIAALSAVLPCRFVGVDGSEGMIAQARKKFAGRANVSLSCQDITKMTFEAGSFDVVMTTQVVHHLQTPNAEDPGPWQECFPGLLVQRRRIGASWSRRIPSFRAPAQTT